MSGSGGGHAEEAVEGRPNVGGGLATPSFAIPDGASTGLPRPLGETTIGGRTFRWGERTYLMGIVNVTPDSFSGDGLMGAPVRDPIGRQDRSGGVPWAGPVAASLAQARRMVEEGADLLDVGGESSRPGHADVDEAEELRRVVPVVAAIHEALPDIPISIDTWKAAVAAAAMDAGAAMINDVWGVEPGPMLQVAADRQVPIVLMHNRRAARYTNLLAEILADMERAIEQALAAGVRWENLIADPGFGFGKAPPHNLALLRELGAIRLLGRPILLGTSRKSTLGRVLDLPPDERLEATLATTALGIAAGVDIVRVHDVRPNLRAARMTDAVVRGRLAL
ncbi:MAG TPA: dihydropteroate synthase [Candidatus Saccharimonadales bacterium]|nr:dihydropteroate synthase [Candidatus Saccharimonadales bacterium]